MDYREVFQGLARYLRENGYGFVVDQVQEELANGHLYGERIRTAAGLELEQSSIFSEARKSKPGDFVRRQEYSDREALILLIQATQRAIVDPSLMVRDVAVELDKADIGRVVFSAADQVLVRSEFERQIGADQQVEELPSSFTLDLHVENVDVAKQCFDQLARVVEQIEGSDAS